MNCEEAVSRLWAYMDSELEARDREAIEKHLSWCLNCCGEYEFSSYLRKFVKEKGGGEELPAGMQERVSLLLGQFERTED